ncbi:MAG: hypothetical protein AAGF46_07550 [Pseudomonadota bacterium]
MQLLEHHSLQAVIEPSLTRHCPHCDVFTRLSLQSAPSWQSLQTLRPARIGVVAVCPACSLPVHLVSERLRYGEHHIELDGGFTAVPERRERIQLEALPEPLRDLVDEALQCHADGHHRAFATLAHRIVQRAARTLGHDGKLRLFNNMTEAAQMAGVEPALLRLCRQVLFDLEADDDIPFLTRTQSQLLFELLRDLLYETFVRSARLQRATEFTRQA